MRRFQLILISVLLSTIGFGQYNEATRNYDLGNEYFQQKEYEKAIEFYSISLSLYRAADAYYNRALSYIRIHDTCNYCRDLESAIRYFDDKEAGKFFYKICARNDTVFENSDWVKEDYQGYKYSVITTNYCDYKVLKSYYNKHNEQIFSRYDKAPEFPGGDTALAHFLNENIKYPQTALEAGIEGTVDATFVVRSDGKLSGIKIARGIGGGCDAEYIRVLKLMPCWKPGLRNGLSVDVIMVLSFTYDKNKYTSVGDDITSNKNDSSTAGEISDINDRDVFAIVEEMPEFPGGDEAKIRYLIDNLHYPQDARNSHIQGTVYASFIVEKDGSVTNIKILRGIGTSCDMEVIRVIQNMPHWIPGKQRGKPVRVRFNMPVRFTLAG